MVKYINIGLKNPPMVGELDVVLKVGYKYGIDEAVSIYTSKIYVNHWVSLKYRYSNQDCCKHTLHPDQTLRLLKEYKRAILVIGNNKTDFHKAVLEMEGQLMQEGYYKAIALINSPCTLCSKQDAARPSLESLGIDILATVRKFKRNIPQPKPGEFPPYAIILTV
jgi:predicted metal-binding protein